MRVGIICEGSTDFAVLESLALELISADECILLQPDFDKLRGGDTTFGPGWQGVRKFLQTSAPGLAIGTFDVVVVQVDASIRNTDAIKRLDLPAPSADEPELSALCSHVKSWAKGGLPSSAVVALPREELETWLVAANTNVRSAEDVGDATDVLVSRGLIGRTADGRPDKKADRYRELSRPLVRFSSEARNRKRVPELDRFIGKLQAQVRAARARKSA